MPVSGHPIRFQLLANAQAARPLPTMPSFIGRVYFERERFTSA
jgi:hypothetical protein